VDIFIGVVTERQWQIFTTALGEPALLDPAWATNTLRSQRRERLIPLVQGLVGKRPVAELEVLCERAGLPFARINTPGDLYDDPHLLASGGLLPITLPDGRPSSVPALPIQFGAERLGVRGDLPTAGQHTREVLEPLLGEWPGDGPDTAAPDDARDHLPTAVAQT